MNNNPYSPIYEFTRGASRTIHEPDAGNASLPETQTVESIHYGAIAVVNAEGKLVAGYGDTNAVAYLRSTAKPFQAISFIEHGGQAHYRLTPREVALVCSSHSGTDEHVAVVNEIQTKTGVNEADLMCGSHPVTHEPTAEAMRLRGEKPGSNRHNCSGKHTGMLAYARMLELSTVDYIDPHHPIQQTILQCFADLCGLTSDQVKVGTDGCSAPNFAIPLYNTALAFARLSDPDAGGVAPPDRALACHTITAAMMANSDMVGGPGRFDTQLMNIGRGRIISKGGAEGYEGIGLMPGALGPGSPALGIALKISDGDGRDRVCSAVSLEVLRQLGALNRQEMAALAQFGPAILLRNWRKLVVGEGRPIFQLQFYE